MSEEMDRLEKEYSETLKALDLKYAETLKAFTPDKNRVITFAEVEKMIAESENRILDILRKSYGQYFL